MNRILKRQLEMIDKKEEKLLSSQENPLFKQKITPLLNKIEEKVPSKLKDVLDTAFYKGFQLVFEKGNKYIEMTYKKDNLRLQYDINNYALDKKLSRKYINNVDKPANKTKAVNSTISLAEGTVLGLLGIGLPDIPLFIAVIIKTIYEIALSYGFQYESDQEKCYILLLICSTMAKDEQQKEFNEQLELLGHNLDNHIETEISLKNQMKITSDVLSNTLLTAKFIQGLPIVGVVGGLVNVSIVNKIGKFAALKYKKRYLLEKVKEQ